MKSLTLLLLALATTSLTFAQKEISLQELTNHVGDSITVRGKIFGIRYLEQARNTPTLLNIGGAYPNQPLTVVIWGDTRMKLSYVPNEKADLDALAVVKGKVELYKGKPQVVITDDSRLLILKDEEVPAGQFPPVDKD